MELNITTRFDEDDKEYCYLNMIALLIKRVKQTTGINLSRIDRDTASAIIRGLVADFCELVTEDAEDDELGESWLSLAWNEFE